MVTDPYVPDLGDLVWLAFTPQAGHEQAGRRPALVLTPRLYNEASGLLIACPVTGHAKGYPFEVPVPRGLPITGVILVDHVKSLDWRARKAEHSGKVTEEVLAQVQERLRALLGL